MQQRIISRVIGNLVKRLAVEVPHLRARWRSQFYRKKKILQIVIFRTVFFDLNLQNPGKMKNSKFSQMSTKKVIFEAKKLLRLPAKHV